MILSKISVNGSLTYGSPRFFAVVGVVFYKCVVKMVDSESSLLYLY